MLLIDWLLTMAVVGGLAHVGSRDRRGEPEEPPHPAPAGTGKRVLVIGAGEAGAMVVREMQRNPQLEMTPVGFLDDDRAKRGKRIYGTLVMGDIVARWSASSRSPASRKSSSRCRAPPAPSCATIAERCQALGLRCRTMPGVYELLGGRISVSRLRTVEIADLLRRSHLADDDRLQEAAQLRSRPTVLVTGAGRIDRHGAVPAGRARASRAHLVLLGHGENSIFDVERLAAARVPRRAASRRSSPTSATERRIESVFDSSTSPTSCSTRRRTSTCR